MDDGTLRDPVSYPNWMWIAGVVILLAVAAWVAFCLIRYRRGADAPTVSLTALSAAERQRYLGLIDEIAGRYRAGELDARGVHLSIAALMRALGTQRSGHDLEVRTAEEVRQIVPDWGELNAVLFACESPSFATEAGSGVDELLDAARAAVDS